MNKTAEGEGNQIQNIGKHNLIQKGGYLHRNKEEIVKFGGVGGKKTNLEVWQQEVEGVSGS